MLTPFVPDSPSRDTSSLSISSFTAPQTLDDSGQGLLWMSLTSHCPSWGWVPDTQNHEQKTPAGHAFSFILCAFCLLSEYLFCVLACLETSTHLTLAQIALLFGVFPWPLQTLTLSSLPCPGTLLGFRKTLSPGKISYHFKVTLGHKPFLVITVPMMKSRKLHLTCLWMTEHLAAYVACLILSIQCWTSLGFVTAWESPSTYYFKAIKGVKGWQLSIK